MVQSISSTNQFGTINNLGQSEDGRFIYRVDDPKNGKSNMFSVAQKDAAKFEKSYKDIINVAPKLQHYADMSPKEVEKRKTTSKFIIGVPITLGILIPMIKVKGSTLKQSLYTLAGGITGAALGLFANNKIMIPDEAVKLSNATKTLSKLDIKQV